MMVKKLSDRVEKQKTMHEHAVEIEHLYDSLLGKGYQASSPKPLPMLTGM